jgi:hypothetical protein
LPAYKIAPRFPLVRTRTSADPPLLPPRWAPPSANSRRRPSLQAPSQGSSKAPTATCCPALHLPTPDFESRRPRHCGLAIAAHQSCLRPSHRNQSTHGKPNCTSPPFVHLLRLSFTAGRARLWISRGMVVNQGLVCNKSNLSFLAT